MHNEGRGFTAAGSGSMNVNSRTTGTTTVLLETNSSFCNSVAAHSWCASPAWVWMSLWRSGLEARTRAAERISTSNDPGRPGQLCEEVISAVARSSFVNYTR